MTDLTNLEREIQLKKEVNNLRSENKVLKERLEFYTDKYGVPNDFAPLPEPSSQEPAVEVNQNLININESKANSEIYKRLVDESIRDLLKIQLNEILEIAATQNKQIVSVYNTITKLKEQLKDK